MTAFKESEKIIKGEFEISADQFCRISYEFKKLDGTPLTLEQINLVTGDLIKVFEKHKMDWKMS